jgi:acetylornithine deacetylase/succinyl-diaminopimelate desuccinylase-like protein
MRLLLALMTLPLAAADPDWAAVEKRAVEFLQEYVRLETVNPPADTRTAAKLFETELRKHGLEPRVYTSGPNGQTNLIVRLAGKDRTKKPLLLLNHFDVVPVDRKAWSVDPFGALIKDGWIWGRGTLDMKGTGVMQLMSLIAMKDTGTVPERDIVMLSTADEETGGELGIKWMMANHPQEIDAEYVLDEGGLGTRDLLAGGKLVFGIAVGEKQMLWLRLKAKGTAAHGSQPIPDNANMILLRAIEKALDLGEGGKRHPVVERMMKEIGQPMAENKFTSAIQRNTMSLTTLTSGVGSPVKVNVIPSSAEATLDCRLLPGVNADEFISGIKARINDPRVTVERISSPVDAGASNSETPLFASISKAIVTHHPGATVTPMLVPFGTDSVNLRKKGVIAYGFMPMVLDAKTHATMHSDEERIPLAEFLKGIHIYFDVLRSSF